MRVLALDLARNSGWAIVDGAETVACGSWNLNREISGKIPLDTQHVMLVQSLRGAVLGVIDTYAPALVAVEREFGRGSGTRLLVSLYTAAQEAAYVAGLPCLGVRLGDWRKAIHGTAGKSTDFYKAEAMRLVPDAVDADAAEAALIGRYVAETAVIHPVAAPATIRKRAAA